MTIDELALGVDILKHYDKGRRLTSVSNTMGHYLHSGVLGDEVSASDAKALKRHGWHVGVASGQWFVEL